MRDHVKAVGLVVLLLAMLGALVYLVTIKADPMAVGLVATPFGAGMTLAFQWLTGRNGTGTGGTAAVILAAGAILAGEQGCRPPASGVEAAAEASYGSALLQCVDAAKTLQESKACRAKVDAEWGIVQTATKDGGR